MKKNRIILIAFASTLFLLPFLSYSNAAPPTYIGVNEGDSYSWSININLDTLAIMIGDINETVPDEFSLFESFPELGLTMKVEYISNEISGSYIDFVLVNLTMAISVPGYGSQQINPPGHFISTPVITNESDNYFFDCMNVMEGDLFSLTPAEMGIPFLIVPQNLNWTKAAQGISDLFDMVPELPSATAQEYGTGLNITIPEQEIENLTLHSLQILAKWNSKGVIESAYAYYNGIVLMSLTPKEEGAIPGYELPIIVAISASAIVGSVYYIIKRKKLL